MNINVDIENTGRAGSERFLLYQHSGSDSGDGAPEMIQEAVDEADFTFADVDGGEWILVVDDDVENLGLSHPFYIEIT